VAAWGSHPETAHAEGPQAEDAAHKAQNGDTEQPIREPGGGGIGRHRTGRL
jgi:hypothetical protein